MHKLNRDRQKYLLSGFVFCGKCGSAMHANRRKKDSQLTFRCNRKAQTITCPTKEINMSYLESYVLDELQRSIFSFSKVPEIMKMVEKYSAKHKEEQQADSNDIKKQIDELEKSKNNIIKAIEGGVFKEHFSDRLAEIKQQEETLKSRLLLIGQPRAFHITEKEIRLLVNNFQRMRKEADFVGLRKIIKSFVDEIKVTDDKIEVKLKMNFGDVNIDSQTLIVEKESLKEQYTCTVPMMKKA